MVVAKVKVAVCPSKIAGPVYVPVKDAVVPPVTLHVIGIFVIGLTPKFVISTVTVSVLE